MKKYFERFGHTCELNDDEEKAKRFNREGIKKTLVKWATIDPTSNLTLQHFNSYSTIVNERKFHLENHPKTIHPFSQIKLIWECLMALAFLCTLIAGPLMFFDYVKHNELETKTTGAIPKNSNVYKNPKNYIEDNPAVILGRSFCVIDIFTRFFTGYIDDENSVIVLSRSKIALKYIRGFLPFDLLANVPFVMRLFASDNGDEPFLMAFHFVKLLMLFRVLRLLTFTRYCQRILVWLGVNNKYLDLFKLSFFWIVSIHWAACLHLVPGLCEGSFKHGKAGLVNAWYEQDVFRRHDDFGRYVVCLFKSVMTLMGLGYVKDLKATQTFDIYYATSLTIFGRIGLCITLAYIYETIQGIRSSSLRYDEIMVQLNKYTEQNNLPPTTNAKLKQNYDYIFRKRYFNEREILKTVPASLRQQILVHNTRQLVENSPFFENLPSYLILKIISTLSIELYLKGDVIYTLGEVGMTVFFISSGSVAFYSPSGKEICHFSDGDYFGELTLVSDIQHHYSKAIALETTECYKLGKDDFQKLTQSYPDLLAKVESLAVERIERVLMIEEREKHRKPFGYVSVNQPKFPSDKHSEFR